MTRGRPTPIGAVSSLSFALKVALALGVVLLLSRPDTARAETPVSIELVLAVDTSLSVDDLEFDLQMSGIARAFRNPEIIALIGQQNGVAVTLFQWNEEVDTVRMIPWHLLTGPASILSFAAKVRALERDPARKFTGIGKALEFGVRLITGNKYAGRLLKIDISGDGRDNIGSLPSPAQHQARTLGIEINGLPILIETYGLEEYYREKVLSGPGAFLEIADDYGDFARAFLRKLRREITPSLSRNDPAPRPEIQQTQGNREGIRKIAAIPMAWAVEQTADPKTGDRVCLVASPGRDVTARLTQDSGAETATWTVIVGHDNSPGSLRYLRIGKAYYTSDQPSFQLGEAREIMALLRSPGELVFEWAQAPDHAKRGGLFGTGDFAAKAAKCEDWIGGTRI